MRQLVLCLLIVAVAACANARLTERLRVGMTKADVIAAMGRPLSFGADKQSEVLYYRLYEEGLASDPHTYFVRLVDGKVASFGRLAEPPAPAPEFATSLPAPPPPPPP